MVALYIILAALLLLFAAAFIPVSLVVYCKDSVRVDIKVLGLTFKSFPKEKKAKPKKAKKSKTEKNSKKPQKDKAEAAQKKKGLRENLGLIKDILSELFGRTSRRIKIKAAKINIIVATDDAAKTALLFPAVNTAVGALVSFLDSTERLTGLNRSDIWVRTDFTRTKCACNIKLVFSLRLWHMAEILFFTAKKYVTCKFFNK